MLSLESVVQRSSDVIAAEADKDLVMVSINNGSYYAVSEVAREIWESIEKPKRINEIVEDLCDLYDIDRGVCEEQTLTFLHSLLNERLLLVANEQAS
jgi:hypothetical protein